MYQPNQPPDFDIKGFLLTVVPKISLLSPNSNGNFQEMIIEDIFSTEGLQRSSTNPKQQQKKAPDPLCDIDLLASPKSSNITKDGSPSLGKISNKNSIKMAVVPFRKICINVLKKQRHFANFQNILSIIKYQAKRNYNKINFKKIGKGQRNATHYLQLMKDVKILSYLSKKFSIKSQVTIVQQVISLINDFIIKEKTKTSQKSSSKKIHFMQRIIDCLKKMSEKPLGIDNSVLLKTLWGKDINRRQLYDKCLDMFEDIWQDIRLELQGFVSTLQLFQVREQQQT